MKRAFAWRIAAELLCVHVEGSRWRRWLWSCVDDAAMRAELRAYSVRPAPRRPRLAGMPKPGKTPLQAKGRVQ